MTTEPSFITALTAPLVACLRKIETQDAYAASNAIEGYAENFDGQGVVEMLEAIKTDGIAPLLVKSGVVDAAIRILLARR